MQITQRPGYLSILCAVAAHQIFALYLRNKKHVLHLNFPSARASHPVAPNSPKQQTSHRGVFEQQNAIGSW